MSIHYITREEAQAFVIYKHELGCSPLYIPRGAQQPLLLESIGVVIYVANARNAAFAFADDNNNNNNNNNNNDSNDSTNDNNTPAN